jgi:hypothetical protein
MSVLIGIVALFAIVVAFKFHVSVRRYKRIEFVRTYAFPRGILARLAENFPP